VIYSASPNSVATRGYCSFCSFAFLAFLREDGVGGGGQSLAVKSNMNYR
jgi:hypothetical protein